MKTAKLIDQVAPRTHHADWIDTVANKFFEKKNFMIMH
jgi:hypothetical protein